LQLVNKTSHLGILLRVLVELYESIITVKREKNFRLDQNDVVNEPTIN